MVEKESYLVLWMNLGRELDQKIWQKYRGRNLFIRPNYVVLKKSPNNIYETRDIIKIIYIIKQRCDDIGDIDKRREFNQGVSITITPLFGDTRTRYPYGSRYRVELRRASSCLIVLSRPDKEMTRLLPVYIA